MSGDFTLPTDAANVGALPRANVTVGAAIPHSLQKRDPADNAAPHWLHPPDSSEVPHWLQNFPDARAPQEGQDRAAGERLVIERER